MAGTSYTEAERALGQRFLDVMDVSTADGVSMGRAMRAAMESPRERHGPEGNEGYCRCGAFVADRDFAVHAARELVAKHRAWLVFEDGDVGDLCRCSCGEQGYDFRQGREWYALHVARLLG